jgi:hypothetical protein
MIKLFHVAAIGALISSALYAYTIKYETLYHSEELQKLKARALKEREAIAVLKAEWQHLNRPERLQVLADRHLQLERLQISQIVRFQDVPAKAAQQDSIGKKLELLGLSDAAPTASLPRTAPAARPAPPATTPRPRPPQQAVTPRPAPAATPAGTRPPAVAPVRAAQQAAASPRSSTAVGRPLSLAPPVPPRPVPQPVRP